MLQLAENNDAIHAALKRRLADVQGRFAGELHSDLACVNTLAEHVDRYRGKMLRPTLVIASALAAFPDRESDADFEDQINTIATVVEMVHMATLVHDDILDEAEMRRRGATINHLRGNEAAVMLGDYLISHAYHLCSSLEPVAVSRAIAAATNTVCEGELLQLDRREDFELDERTYFEIVRRKTASLCGACCRMPLVLVNGQVDGGGSAMAEALYRYGETLGIAFQIIDDILDLSGDTAAVGKTLGRDLEKGKLTLPLIRLLKTADPSQRAQLLADLAEPQDPAALERIHAELNASDGIEHAKQTAAGLVEDAKRGLLDTLPQTPARDLLSQMADAVITRRF